MAILYDMYSFMPVGFFMTVFIYIYIYIYEFLPGCLFAVVIINEVL